MEEEGEGVACVAGSCRVRWAELGGWETMSLWRSWLVRGEVRN